MSHSGSASVSTTTLKMFVPSSSIGHLAVNRAKRGSCGTGSVKAFRAREAPSQKLRRGALINHTTMAQRGDKDDWTN